jgi:hypothetical protein
MRIEVTFRHTETKAVKVITVRARSIAEGLVGARVMFYTELDDRKAFLSWGVQHVRKLEE